MWWTAAMAGVVIDEFVADPSGTDAGREWVELHNASASPVELEGWVLEAGTTTFRPRYTLPDVVLAADERLVIGESDVEQADELLPVGERLQLGNATSSADALRLVRADGSIADTVVYGPTNTDAFADDTGERPLVLAPAPEPDAALARVGPDTDGMADFHVLPPTPGEPSSLPPCDVNGTVVVNEVMVDPEGPDADQEWFELLAQTPVDLTGWTLRAGTRSYTQEVELAPVTLEAGQLWLVATSSVHGPDQLVDRLSFGNGSGADALQLVDCEGQPVDTLVYGAPNEDGWLDDQGHLAVPTPVAQAGWSLARVPDGLDTDHPDDLQARSPTPGLPNAVDPTRSVEPPHVRITEVLVDPEGPDAEREWVELHNLSPSTVSLEGWTLNGRPLPASSVAPTERLLVEPLPVSLPDDAGSLVLADPTGRPVYALSWGPDALPAPPTGLTLQLRADGWQIGRPTPGLPNPLPPAFLHPGCSAVGPLGGSSSLFLLLPAILRMRRSRVKREGRPRSTRAPHGDSGDHHRSAPDPRDGGPRCRTRRVRTRARDPHAEHGRDHVRGPWRRPRCPPGE